MRVYSGERLWKQLSDTLLVYTKYPEINCGTNLKDLFEGFVKDFYNEIDEIKLVRFLIKAAD
jgi:26S proteasome regulatory subunit N9